LLDGYCDVVPADMEVKVAVGVVDEVSDSVPELLMQPELPMLLPDMSIV